MSKRPLNEKEQADLVAFLDGEMTGEAKRAIEAKLTLDPHWRAEAESLKRAWDLLDFLPKPPDASPSFTQHTLSKIGPLARPTHRSTFGGWKGSRWLALGGAWAAAVVLAALVGYFGTRALLPTGPGEGELTRDLRIIENKKLYDLIEDIDFLHELEQPDLFGEDSTGG